MSAGIQVGGLFLRNVNPFPAVSAPQPTVSRRNGSEPGATLRGGAGGVFGRRTPRVGEFGGATDGPRGSLAREVGIDDEPGQLIGIGDWRGRRALAQSLPNRGPIKGGGCHKPPIRCFRIGGDELRAGPLEMQRVRCFVWDGVPDLSTKIMPHGFERYNASRRCFSAFHAAT